jgi:hypothetical protein
MMIRAVSLRLLAFAALAAAGTATAAVTSFTAAPHAAPPVAVNPGAAGDDGWQVVLDQVYSIPRGMSYSPLYKFQTPAQVDALRVELTDATIGECGASVYSVDVQTMPGQSVLSRYFPDGSGTVSLPNTTVYQFMVIVEEPRFRGGTCDLRLSAMPQGGGTDGNYVLAGVIHYAGGFQSHLSLAATPTDLITHFWARVPTFCQGADVLEGGTTTEGVYDVAQETDATRHIFEVNGGAGTRISSIELSLNGPSTLTCDIPIYTEAKQPQP